MRHRPSPCSRTRRLAPLSGLALLIACGVPEADTVDGAAAGASTAVAASELHLADLERTVGILHEKMTALAEAFPEEGLSWRPMEGVRSPQEVFVHVAADNWFVPALMGWPAPSETAVTADQETFRSYQARTMSRAEMLEALGASFEFLRAAMEESAGDLDRSVTLGGRPTTVGDVWVRATVHLHEHLGQSIAYARTNGVVPPWSR